MLEVFARLCLLILGSEATTLALCIGTTRSPVKAKRFKVPFLGVSLAVDT